VNRTLQQLEMRCGLGLNSADDSDAQKRCAGRVAINTIATAVFNVNRKATGHLPGFAAHETRDNITRENVTRQNALRENTAREDVAKETLAPEGTERGSETHFKLPRHFTGSKP
jgi:hypothetical protein